MGILNLFSKRQRKIRGELPDVYQYDVLPRALRVQIINIWSSAIGRPYYGDQINIRQPNAAAHCFQYMVEALRHERGVFRLTSTGYFPDEELTNYFLNEDSVELALDVVEVAFTYASAKTNHIDELNARFREHGVGFQLEARQIVRVDSQFIHAEIVKPALVLLHQPGFEGPQQELLRGHEHYRHKRHKECLVECLKAFESTMKSICDRRGWGYGKRPTAKTLIKACFDNELVPAWLEQQFASMRQLLESGAPTVRNKTAGHGQGSAVQEIPGYLASYGLHLTASNIVFLVKAHLALGA